MLRVTEKVGFGARGSELVCSDPVTIWSRAPGVNGSNWHGYSIRHVFSILADFNQMRLVAMAGSSGVSLRSSGAGIRSGETSATIAAPVQTLWNDGNAAITIGANSEAASDWADLVGTIVQEGLAILDVDLTGGGSLDRLSPDAGNDHYQRANYQSYDEQAPSGFSISLNNSLFLLRVEGRVCV